MSRRAIEMPSDPARSAGLLERVALGALLAIIAVRPMLSETVTFESPSWTRGLDAPAGPQPATTLIFAVSIFAAAALTFASRLWRGAPLRATGAELGALLLIVAGGVSLMQAGQQQLAFFGTLNFLSFVLLFLAMAQLLDAPWKIRLATCVVLASSAVFAVRCFWQIFVDYPDTLAYFEQYREQWVALAGEDGAGRLYDFTQRMKSNAATGYFGHANVAASYLATVFFVALACAFDRARSVRAGRAIALIGPIVVAALAVGALVTCQSKGAAAAIALGAVAWAIGSALGGRISCKPIGAVVAFWLAAALGVAGVAALGLSRGGLPTLSMLYRWQYWRGAAAMLAERGWLGIGCDNFGRLFTRYKPLECPEEVLDPHSWLVRLLVEWGALGLLGIVLLFVGISIGLARPRRSPAEAFREQAAPGSIRTWFGVVGISALVCWLATLADSATAYIVLTLFIPVLLWPLVSVALTLPATDRRFNEAPVTAMLPALVAAAVAFLAHAAIDLAMFSSGAATTFFAVLAIAFGVTRMNEPIEAASTTARSAAPSARPRPGFALGIGVAAAIALTAFVTRFIVPAHEYAAQLRAARTAPAPPDWDSYRHSTAYRAYMSALDLLPRDGTAAAELIGQLLPRVRTVEHCDAIAPLIATLRARDPQNSLGARNEAALMRMRFELSGDVSDLERAIAAARAAVEAYPTSPGARLMLAEFLDRLNGVRPEEQTRTEAIRQYEQALQQDEGRRYISAPNHLSPKRKAEVTAAIQRLIGPQTRSATTKSS